MQFRGILGAGAAILTLSLQANAFAQAAPNETYMPPPPTAVQPAPPYVPPNAYPAQPAYGQPAYGQPAYGQPAYGQPAYGQPAYGQPAYGQPAYGQPGQPVYTYPPGAQPPMQPNYYPGATPPPPHTVRGYKMAPRVGLIVGGSVMLGSMWLITAVAGGIASATCDVIYDSSSGYSSGCANTYWPLFIPVVGPWAQMHYVPNDSARGLAMFGLAFDGLVQAGGLAMIIAGATVRHRVPIFASKNMQLSPTFTSGGSGLALSGRF